MAVSWFASVAAIVLILLLLGWITATLVRLLPPNERQQKRSPWEGLGRRERARAGVFSKRLPY